MPAQVHYDLTEPRYMHAGIVEGEQWVMEFEDEPIAKLCTSGLEIRNERWFNRLSFHDGDTYYWARVCAVPPSRVRFLFVFPPFCWFC